MSVACTTEAPRLCGGRMVLDGRCPKPDCLKLHGEYVVTGDRGCFFGFMNDLTKLGSTGADLCIDATSGATGGGTQTFCRRITPNLTVAVELNSNLHRIPPNFYPCLSAGGLRLTTYFPTDCPPVCGNGILEPGEECDGENLGAPADCSAYLSARGLDSTGVTGSLACTTDCLRDLSGCVIPQ